MVDYLVYSHVCLDYGGHLTLLLWVSFSVLLQLKFKQVGIKKNEKLPIYMYLGIAYAAMMGQILFHLWGQA